MDASQLKLKIARRIEKNRWEIKELTSGIAAGFWADQQLDLSGITIFAYYVLSPGGNRLELSRLLF